MNILVSMLVGVLGSFVASAMFLFVLFKVRPSLDISPFIAREQVRDRHVHVFKIVNRTSRAIVNLRVELLLKQSVSVEGGPMHWLKEVTLTKSSIMFLPRYDKQDVNAAYAFRLSTAENIDELWQSEGYYLELRVVGNDSVSGFTRAFRKEFRTKRNTIVEGSHVWGTGLEVK